MKNSKFKVFVFEFLLIVILFFALFASNIITRQVLSIVMLIYMLITYFCLKKRNIVSIYKKQVTILMLIFALIYLGAFYLTGFYFGFVRAKVLLSMWSIFRFIVPLTIIIISSEIIRTIFLSQNLKIDIKGRKIDVSLTLTYISMVLVDLVIYTGVYDLTNLNDFLVALGFVLFASLSCNLVFNYISSRYGSKGNIVFRLITILYMYIIPVIPNVYIFFRSFFRMIYPYIIYLVLDALYSKNDFAVSYNEKKSNFIWNSVLFVVIVLLIMLISCQFRYGILVVGSRSMTGTLNKGDAVVFENYDQQDILNGQVIIFDYNGVQTIHRVIEIKEANGETRYYTKGDANKTEDDDYRTKDEIHGLVKLKVKHIGYPTLWVRDLFTKE